MSEYDGRASPIRVEHSNGRYSTIDYTHDYIFVNGIIGTIKSYKKYEPKRSLHYLEQPREKGSFSHITKKP